MDTLVLKLLLTPALIAAASLAGRRWGQAVSGWFVGLPLTSGPIAFFVALDLGVGFAAATALGALAAAIAEAAFCLAYGHSARRARWPLALAAACVAFAATAVALQPLSLPVVPVAALVFVTLAAALRFMPRGSEATTAQPPPRWDLPARMVIATVLVVLITEAAPILGPRVSAGFFLVLGLLIERAGIALAFTAAIATTLAIQAASLGLVLRSPKRLGA